MKQSPEPIELYVCSYDLLGEVEVKQPRKRLRNEEIIFEDKRRTGVRFRVSEDSGTPFVYPLATKLLKTGVYVAGYYPNGVAEPVRLVPLRIGQEDLKFTMGDEDRLAVEIDLGNILQTLLVLRKTVLRPQIIE